MYDTNTAVKPVDCRTKARARRMSAKHHRCPRRYSTVGINWREEHRKVEGLRSPMSASSWYESPANLPSTGNQLRVEEFFPLYTGLKEGSVSLGTERVGTETSADCRQCWNRAVCQLSKRDIQLPFCTHFSGY